MASLLTVSAELAALRAERDAFQQQAQSLQEHTQALQQQTDALQGELRVHTVERDLLREQLKAFQRKLFDALFGVIYRQLDEYRTISSRPWNRCH
jgi:uncharacterized coiled-coil DUF342 family protein